MCPSRSERAAKNNAVRPLGPRMFTSVARSNIRPNCFKAKRVAHLASNKGTSTISSNVASLVCWPLQSLTTAHR